MAVASPDAAIPHGRTAMGLCHALNFFPRDLFAQWDRPPRAVQRGQVCRLPSVGLGDSGLPVLLGRAGWCTPCQWRAGFGPSAVCP